VHPINGTPGKAEEVVDDLVRHIRPALDDAGDLDVVTETIGRIARTGTSAQRQRAAFGENSKIESVVDLLVKETAVRP
jgi:carboxylate-amine ligase